MEVEVEVEEVLVVEVLVLVLVVLVLMGHAMNLSPVIGRVARGAGVNLRNKEEDLPPEGSRL